MKRSLLAFLLAFILAFTLAVPAAGADGGRLGDLLNKVRSVFADDSETAVEESADPDGRGLGSLIRRGLGKVQEMLDEEGIDVESLIGRLFTRFTGSSGEEAVGEIAGLLGGLLGGEGEADLSGLSGLLGMLGGGDDDTDLTDADIDSNPYIIALRARDAAVEAYIIDEYKDILEPGDVQIVITNILINDEDDPTRNLGYFELKNYTVDGVNLMLKNSMGHVEYLTFTVNEEGVFELAEAVRAEEGDGYEASVAAMCEKYGITPDAFYAEMGNMDFYETLQLSSFLMNHPEYEKIEYNGEPASKDDLDAVWTGTFGSLFEELDLTGDSGDGEAEAEAGPEN